TGLGSRRSCSARDWSGGASAIPTVLGRKVCDRAGADVRQIAQCCGSAEDGEHAATAGELEALAPRGLAKACEQDLARGLQQRPAIVGGAQPETVGRTVGEP